MSYSLLRKSFKKGDILYGCAKDRLKALHRIHVPILLIPFKQHVLDEIDSNPPFIDPLNNRGYCLRLGIYRGLDSIKDPKAKEFFKYLEKHPKYDPRLIPNPDISNSKHYKHLAYANLEDDFLVARVYNFEINQLYKQCPKVKNTADLRIRRSCKGGITRVLDSENDNKIHFILGEFNPIEALNKLGKRSITNTEFRLIYREWIKRPEVVDKKIIFWDKDMKPITASKLFNSIGMHITYKPKFNSIKNQDEAKHMQEKSLEKLKEWANKPHNCKDHGNIKF